MFFIEVFSIPFTTFVHWRENLDGCHQLSLCDITNFNGHVWHSTRHHCCQLYRGRDNHCRGAPTSLWRSSLSHTDIGVQVACGHGNIFWNVSDEAECCGYAVFCSALESLF